MIKINDVIQFGVYRWIVLEIKIDKALIISEKIIEKRPYHKTYAEVTWETCDLRSYLNGDFLDKFSKEERLKIIPTQNINLDNPWYLTPGGNDTLDYIFLLDIYDVCMKYFGDSSRILLNKREKQKYWFGTNDPNNLKRVANYNQIPYWWWIRTPGRNHKTAVYIHGNPKGIVGINGNNVLFKSYPESRNGGIRPALWMKLD